MLAPQAGPTAPQASPPDIPAFLVVFCSLWAGFLAVFGPFENALRQGFPIFKNPVTMGNFLQDATRGRLKLLQGMEMALNPDAGLLFGAFRAVHSPLARSTR